MGIEDFYEFRRLIGRPYPPQGPAYERAALDPDAWERASLRFARLVDVWLHQPLTDAGFCGKSPRWVFGRGAVRPVVDVQRHPGAQLEDGLIDFTVNWGLWVEGFARRVSRAKRLTPRTAQAPFQGRIGDLMRDGRLDVWWAVTPESVVRHMPPRVEPDPPSAGDEVPEVLRTRLIPMLTPIDTVAGVIEAMERSAAAGVGKVWWDHPLDVLRQIARE